MHWNKLDLNVKKHGIFNDHNNEKLIIANGCLFFVQICYLVDNRFI